MQALTGLFSNLFNSTKPVLNHTDTSSHRWKSTTNQSTVFPMEQASQVSELESWKNQLYAPDTKGNCGISGFGIIDALNPRLNAADVVKCPSTELKARYFTTPGGGDGGGATFECTVESLAKFYECTTEQVESCRIAQVALSLNDSVRAEQLDRLKALLDENGFDVVLEKWPETDFSPLRDGLNGERHRQGKLVHALIQPKEPLSDSQLDSKTTSIISTFNIHEKARQLGQDDYEMASFFGISPREIICKSFKGDAIHQLFPFLEKLDVKSTKFHGREATNTGPQQISIHPMSEMSLVHNGEINNIKNLRLFLANNDAFKSYTKWSDDDFGMSLFDVLNEFSDTAILTQYLAFCQSLGESIPDVLRRTFIPDTVHNNLTFNAEGPAFIACTDSKGHTYIARDSQGQRPAELEVAIKDGKIMAYRYGSVSGIQSPFTLPEGLIWQRMDLNPGRVVEIAPQTESGVITEFVITEYMAQGMGTLPEIESGRRSSRSARHDLEASRRLNQASMDHEVKVAMGAQNKPGPWPFLCTAGITNTSASQGINVSHPLQPFHQGEGEFKGTHPILSHDTANYILEDESTVTVNATLSKKAAKQFIDTHKGLEDEIDRIVSDCETALLEGARTLHLNFIDGSRIPMFPRELILNKVSKLLAKYNKDGLVESRQKVNLVVSTHSLMHAQDAYTLMAAGAGFVYFPHVESETVEGYNAQLDELRSELMTLSMRAGITRLAQLTGSGLYYYQHASELASHQNVVNIGSSNYDSYSALNFVYRTQLGVAKDLGITSDSPNQRLSLETSMLQHEDMVVARRRINAASGISPTIMVPTENSHLRPKHRCLWCRSGWRIGHRKIIATSL